MKTVLIVIAAIIIVFGLWALSAWITMLLANIVLEYLGLKTLTFWVAFALTALLSIVGSGFRTVINKA